MGAKTSWDWLRDRSRGSRAAWAYRQMSVGPGAKVRGRPLVRTADAVAGARFKTWSDHRRTNIQGAGRIRFGDDVYLNYGSFVWCRQEITIGSRVAVGWESVIVDSDDHGLEGGPMKIAPVRVEDGVWIGARCLILPGVTIGEMSVVAAGSVVTKDVPARTVVAGVPARVLRELSYPEGVDRAWT